MSKKAVDLGLELIEAVKNNNVEELKLLIEKGADVNAVTISGETALMMATKKNNKEIAELLIKAGAKQNG